MKAARCAPALCGGKPILNIEIRQVLPIFRAGLVTTEAAAQSSTARPAKIVSAKYYAVEACWRIVEGMEVSGGAGMFRACN